MEDIILFLKDGKNLANLLVLIIIVLALPVGISLVRKQEVSQTLAQSSNITIAPGNTNIETRASKQVLVMRDGQSSDTVAIKVSIPTSQSGINNSLVSKVYADDQCPDTYSCSGDHQIQNQGYYNPDTTACSYTTNDLGYDPSCAAAANPSPPPNPCPAGTVFNYIQGGCVAVPAPPPATTQPPPAPSQCTTNCPSGYSGTCGGHNYNDGNGCQCETRAQTCTPNGATTGNAGNPNPPAPSQCTTNCPSGYSGTCGGHNYNDGNGCQCETRAQTCTPNGATTNPPAGGTTQPPANPGSCSAPAQSPSLSSDCQSCLNSNKTNSSGSLPQQMKNLSQSQYGGCSDSVLINQWCNGVDTSGCNNLKNGACSSQCSGSGGNPSPSPSPSPSPLQVSCNPNNTNIAYQGSVTWSANVSGGSGSGYTYSWSGDNMTDNGQNNNTVTYNKSGVQKASVTVKDKNSAVSPVTVACSQTVTVGTAVLSFKIVVSDAAHSQTDLSSAQTNDISKASGPINVIFDNSTYSTQNYTPGEKNIYVQFAWSDGTTTTLDPYQLLVVPPNPKIPAGGVSCNYSIDKSGVIFNVTGSNFGNDVPKMQIVQPVTKDLEVKAHDDKSAQGFLSSSNIDQSLLDSDFLVTVTRPANDSSNNPSDQTITSPSTCHIGLSQITVTTPPACASLAALASSNQASNIDLEFVEKNNPSAQVVKEDPASLHIDSQGHISGMKTVFQQGKTYQASLKIPRSLRVVSEVFSPAGATASIPFDGPLPFGDIYQGGHGAINSFDKSELNNEWGPGNNKAGDLNGDGVVNSFDWACMKLSFGKQDQSALAPDQASTNPANPTPSSSPSTSPSPSPSPVCGSCGDPLPSGCHYQTCGAGVNGEVPGCMRVCPASSPSQSGGH